MTTTVFWAWQSDQDERVCRHFIKSALVAAVRELAADLELDERPEIDHDTKNEAGMPDIVDTILQKIAASSAFVADLTTVARTKKKKALANPNVLIELGYAKRAIGPDRIICVANSAWYRGPEDLPFDLRNRRGPITYLLPPESDKTAHDAARSKLVNALKNALRPILQKRAVSSTTVTLDDEWYNTERATAQAGITKVGLAAQMELCLHSHMAIAKSHRGLLEAVRQSQITTFGWPIGILIETPEFAPAPSRDGVRMEISADHRDHFGKSYDYWSLRSNGDMFLLKSLFEDTQAENVIFFNTRIIRVAEALLFAERLYRSLGAADGSKFTVRVAHRNFAGRGLSAVGSRSIFPAKARENESTEETVLSVGHVSATLPLTVKTLLSPLFVLFEFKEFGDAIYEDVVRRFERGECS